ncbi:MAG: HesB/IscA family protein, partial [Gemmatimonadota bacterium]
MSQTAQKSGVPAEEALVTLTPEAAQKVREFLAAEGETGAVLRASVLPGGCSGFEYGLEVDTEIRGDDFVFESEGIRLVVDPFSAQYLTGVRIGYHSSFQG